MKNQGSSKNQFGKTSGHWAGVVSGRNMWVRLSNSGFQTWTLPLTGWLKLHLFSDLKIVHITIFPLAVFASVLV